MAHDITYGDDNLNEAFYSMGDWDTVPKSEWEDVDFSMNDVMNAFWDGFVDADLSPDQRHDARETFFEYAELLGWDYEDFDWDAFREWYSE